MKRGDRRAGLRRAAHKLMRARAPAHVAAPAHPAWPAGFFGLAAVSRYRRAPRQRREAVLAECVGALLSESWHIEKSGMLFCARMTLACETDEERRVFALIGADEAAHSAWLEPWMHGREREPGAFNRFIAGLVETGTPQALSYLLQVVLEGFGITHYAGLAAGCQDAALAAVLRRMSQDEAAHHAAGLAAFGAERLGAPDRRFVSEGAYAFLQMVRSGPQAVVAALDRGIGVSAPALAGVFDALGAEAASARKLARLHKLMARPGMGWLVEQLEEKGAFKPCTPGQSAALYASAR